MSNTEFGWESLLHTDVPPECSLQSALFTTYDRADELFLAEHLLPLLLKKLGHEPAGEGSERQYFLLELDFCLKQLHDRLIVVSSTVWEEPWDAEEGESGAYGWIWRSIRHLTVGRRGKAVQHAKLWMHHWGADKEGIEYLEIVVSSANLTRAAFKGQLQGAWRACLVLHPQRSKERLRLWGVLPEFLRELAASAGDEGCLNSFVELLARADCPEGIIFVASVPGKHSPRVLRQTPWGAAGLQKIMPLGRGTVNLEILTPFVGSWSSDVLRYWCARFEGSPDRLSLVWIENNHPWAGGKWLMPEHTLKTLRDLDARLLKLRHDSINPDNNDPFHEQHRPANDPRWSHAKVYLFRRGASRRLLVTSANFSPSAWGRQMEGGGLLIDNFELGVCVKQATWPFNDLEVFDNVQDAAVSELPRRGFAPILWASAVWDGNEVDVACRCEEHNHLQGGISSSGKSLVPITTWTIDAEGLRSATVPWLDAKRPPSFVQLTCADETVTVPIFDARPWPDRQDTFPPEVNQDEDTIRRMCDELLFEQYGGRVADDADSKLLPNSNEELGEEDVVDGSERSDSYSVPAFELARWHLGVVDNWAHCVEEVAERATEDLERQLLLRDGELLIQAFNRQAERDGEKESARAIGAKLAAEELTVRLKHFREA